MGGLDLDNNQYSDILKEYSEQDIIKRFLGWHRELSFFIAFFELDKLVRIDEKKLGYAVLDYYADIVRMKEFHKIDHANLSKIYAYSTYWLWRDKPLQVTGDVDDDKYVFINELFVTLKLCSNISGKCSFEEEKGNSEEILEKFSDLLLYNLKYRVITQTSLELAITSFFVGAGISTGELYEGAV